MLVPTRELVDLSGRVALVTGGAKGIGKGIALRLAEAGANVLITDLDEEAGAAAVEEGAALEGELAFARADAGPPEEASRVVALASSKWGRLDVLVNNAGIFPPIPVEETSPEAWRRVMALNLDGAFFHCQAAARAMRAADIAGSLVNIASIDAIHPSGQLVHYDASKAGMVMMTRALAKELGSAGIRVNAISPGGVRTPGASAIMGEMGAALGVSGEQVEAGFVGRIPLGRMGEPDDIARAVLFFASPLSNYISGVNLVVDGGFLVG